MSFGSSHQARFPHKAARLDQASHAFARPIAGVRAGTGGIQAVTFHHQALRPYHRGVGHRRVRRHREASRPAGMSAEGRCRGDPGRVRTMPTVVGARIQAELLDVSCIPLAEVTPTREVSPAPAPLAGPSRRGPRCTDL